MTRSLPLLTVLLAGLVVSGVGAPKPAPGPTPTAALAETAHGTFDMTRNPRPWIVYMILDQEGNRYPSFWCGGNVGGTIVFGGKLDDLDGTFGLNQTGGFTVSLIHTARKTGMFGVLPAGDWMDGIRNRNMKVTFERFTEATIASEDKLIVKVSATCEGTIGVGERRAPFKGTATLSFSRVEPTFAIAAKFPLPGKALGLDGSKGEGITATLYTASANTLAGAGAPVVGSEDSKALGGDLPVVE
jgi:hypothetical protein